jgi:hypothetical protein
MNEAAALRVSRASCRTTFRSYLRDGRKELFDAKAMEALSRPSRGEQRARTPSVQ